MGSHAMGPTYGARQVKVAWAEVDNSSKSGTKGVSQANGEKTVADLGELSKQKKGNPFKKERLGDLKRLLSHVYRSAGKDPKGYKRTHNPETKEGRAAIKRDALLLLKSAIATGNKNAVDLCLELDALEHASAPQKEALVNASIEVQTSWSLCKKVVRKAGGDWGKVLKKAIQQKRKKFVKRMLNNADKYGLDRSTLTEAKTLIQDSGSTSMKQQVKQALKRNEKHITSRARSGSDSSSGSVSTVGVEVALNRDGTLNL